MKAEVYWVSPSVRTAVASEPWMRFDVRFWAQADSVPFPPFHPVALGLQAMSPAAKMNGSQAVSNAALTTPITAIRIRAPIRAPQVHARAAVPRRRVDRGADRRSGIEREPDHFAVVLDPRSPGAGQPGHNLQAPDTELDSVALLHDLGPGPISVPQLDVEVPGCEMHAH